MVKRGVLTHIEQEASWTKRIIVYLIDFVAVNIIISVPFGKVVSEETEQWFSIFAQSASPKVIMVSVAMAVLTYVYFVVTEYKVQQTLGKLILGIKISSTEKQTSLAQILLRNISKPFPLVLFIDTLYAWVKGGKQRVLERWSQTSVVQYHMELK